MLIGKYSYNYCINKLTKNFGLFLPDRVVLNTPQGEHGLYASLKKHFSYAFSTYYVFLFAA